MRMEVETKIRLFWRLDKKWGQEPGDYHVWVGHDSDCTLGGSFRITE